MKLQSLILLNLFTCFANTFAAETDQFTRRSEPLEDSSTIINKKANISIQEALKQANLKNDGCRQDELYAELRKYFANHMSGKLTIDILTDKKLPRRDISLSESVYGTWSPWDGMGLGLFLKKKANVVMSPVVNIGGHTIGTDKFEHMFGQGFYYFTQGYLKGEGVVKAVKSGAFREKFMLGGTRIGNGVYSYGDLSANFNGMRFWNHMLQKYPDPLGSEHDIGPYIACEKNRWVQVKQVDFAYYVDPSMDEGINCSKFPGQKTVNKFVRKVEARGLSCPVDPKLLEEMVIKYKHMAKWMINQEGSGKIKYTGEFSEEN
jgi:hypothetical protein